MSYVLILLLVVGFAFSIVQPTSTKRRKARARLTLEARSPLAIQQWASACLPQGPFELNLCLRAINAVAREIGVPTTSLRSTDRIVEDLGLGRGLLAVDGPFDDLLDAINECVRRSGRRWIPSRPMKTVGDLIGSIGSETACLRCGYSLHQLDGGPCPECGAVPQDMFAPPVGRS